MFFKSKFLLLTLILLLAGCAKNITPMIPQASKTKHTFIKNYTLNKKKSINVGEPVVRVKDYTIVKSSTDALVPTKNFNIKTDAETLLNGEKGEPIQIVGTVQGDDGTYYLTPSLVDRRFLVAFHESGVFNGKIAVRIVGAFHSGNQVTIGNWDIPISPSSTRFELAQKEEIDSTAGYINFEIIYTGMTKDAINFLYREYTSEDMARPAFYQNLTYPRNAKSIRFKSIKINLIDINEESVTYAVVEE